MWPKVRRLTLRKMTECGMLVSDEVPRSLGRGYKDLSRHGTVVRQAAAGDPEMVPEEKLIPIAEGQPTGQAVEELHVVKVAPKTRILK